MAGGLVQDLGLSPEFGQPATPGPAGVEGGAGCPVTARSRHSSKLHCPARCYVFNRGGLVLIADNLLAAL